MKAYLIANIEITDPEVFKEYQRAAGLSVDKGYTGPRMAGKRRRS
jgi:uncharacterized protein (DUF1330 family)